MNTKLTRMAFMKIKTVAYADDVAVGITGKHLNIISQCIEAALKVLNLRNIPCR